MLGLPFNKVLGFARTIKDRDFNPHSLLHASTVVLTMMIGLITLVMVAIVIVVTTGWTRVAPAIEISIVRGCIVRARQCARWGLTVIARVVTPGVVVFVSTWVTPRARGVLVIAIAVMVTRQVFSAMEVPLIMRSIYGDRGKAITSTIMAIIVVTSSPHA